MIPPMGRLEVLPALVITCLAATAHADPEADRLFEEGRKLLATQPEQACAKFDEAIKRDPDAPGVLLNLGLCNEKVGKYKTALYWFRKAQVRATESNLPDYVDAAVKHTSMLSKQVARVNIEFTEPPPADAKVEIDGEVIAAEDYPHAEVDPGHHALDAGAPGKKIVHIELDVPKTPPGQDGQTINLAPIALVAGENIVIVDRGATRRKIAWVSAIGGAALMIASGGIALYEHGKYCDQFTSDDKCGDATALKQDATGENHRKAANDAWSATHYGATTVFVVGAAAVGVGIALYFTAPAKERIDRTVFVPAVSRDQIGFALSGRF
jgi:tetratricopeptide (TPR) repeat protein